MVISSYSPFHLWSLEIESSNRPLGTFGAFLWFLSYGSKAKTVDEVDLDSLPLWAQIHGLLLGHSTQDMAIAAASQIGEMFEVDFRSSKAAWVTQFIRVKVLVALSHPLSPGFFLPRTNRDDTWIQFKYEKVLDFYFNCGLLSHLTNSCQAAPFGKVEPATFSSRMFAHSKVYKRFVAPNRLISKGPVLLGFHHNAPAQSQHN